MSGDGMRIGIIGLGTMGRSLAKLCLEKGMRVAPASTWLSFARARARIGRYWFCNIIGRVMLMLPPECHSFHSAPAVRPYLGRRGPSRRHAGTRRG